MNKSLKIIIVISIILCGGWLTIQSMHKNKHVYALYIGTNQGSFEDDSTASASGEAIDGGVFIYLNGNCISFYAGYGKMLQVNQWLKNNKNIISLKGSSSKTIYIKIAKYDPNGEYFKVLSKEIVKVGKIDFYTKFIADIDYTLPLFESSIAANNFNIDKELKKEILELKSIIGGKNQIALFDKLLAGPAIWQPMAYSADWSQLGPVLKNKIRYQFLIEDNDSISFDEMQLKFLKGDNSVYAYSGINKEGSIPGAYLFNMKNKNEALEIPALKFVRIGGKWVVWE